MYIHHCFCPCHLFLDIFSIWLLIAITTKLSIGMEMHLDSPQLQVFSIIGMDMSLYASSCSSETCVNGAGYERLLSTVLWFLYHLLVYKLQFAILFPGGSWA